MRGATGSGIRRQVGLRLIAAVLVVGLSTGAVMVTTVLEAPPASAIAQTLYATTSALGTGNCSTPTNACTLATALNDIVAGGTIELVTPGNSAPYSGGFTVSTSGTSASLPVTIEPAPGGANATFDGGHSETVLTVNRGVYLNISEVTVQNGASDGEGGGIDNSGTVNVIDSTLSGNSADEGGGIFNSGTVNVTDSTLSGNSASLGGGIFNSSGTVNVIDSTLSGNSATYSGGGILNNSGTVNVTDSTLSGNNAGYRGGGISNSATVNVGATIVANSSGGDCANYGTRSSNGYNIDDDTSCSFSGPGDINDSSSLDTYLGPLQNNGGPTQTMALLPGSPAIDKVPAKDCSSTDQRGAPRTAPCDIGAYDTDFPNFSTFSPVCATGTGYYLYASSTTGNFAGLFCVNAAGTGTYTQYSVPAGTQTATGTGTVKVVGAITAIAASGTGLALLGELAATSNTFTETARAPMKTGTFSLTTTVPTPANDGAVQANLTSGLIATKAFYLMNDLSDSGVLAGLPLIDPSISWTAATTSCTASAPTCISVGSVDVSVSGDQQGAITAAMSNTGTCYWVADLEAFPVAVVPSTGFLLNATVGQPGNESSGSPPSTITFPGTYYAEKSGPGAAAECNASYPMTASAGFNWGPGFSVPGSAG